jgi:hypothetical protein
MAWLAISPLQSEDVIPAARDFVRRGITNPQTIESQLLGRGWGAACVWAVIRQVERRTGAH